MNHYMPFAGVDPVAVAAGCKKECFAPEKGMSTQMPPPRGRRQRGVTGSCPASEALALSFPNQVAHGPQIALKRGLLRSHDYRLASSDWLTAATF
jgi:hypothetical protein